MSLINREIPSREQEMVTKEKSSEGKRGSKVEEWWRTPEQTAGREEYCEEQGIEVGTNVTRYYLDCKTPLGKGTVTGFDGALILVEDKDTDIVMEVYYLLVRP